MERKVIKGVDTKVLTEINRSREIMGLGQLLREQTAGDASEVENWLRGDGAQSSPKITNLVAKLESTNLVGQDMGDTDVWGALQIGFNDITGKNIVECDDEGDCEGSKAAFLGGQFYTKDMRTYRYKEYGPSDNPKMKSKNKKFALADDQLKYWTQSLAPKSSIILSGVENGQPTCIVTSGELNAKKQKFTLSQLIYDINTFNMENVGKEQLVWFNTKKYVEAGGSNVLHSKSADFDDKLVLWSNDTKKITMKTTPEITEPGEIIAGDVLNAPLGDKYADNVIEITDTSPVDAIKEKIAAHLAKPGGKVNSITITSTASDTGHKTDPKSRKKYSDLMTAAGFGQYANINPAKAGVGPFTEDEVEYNDQALAVARGKLLAKLLGYGDNDVTYKFAITNDAKTVNVSVKGTSDDTVEDDKIIDDGSVDQKDDITGVGGSIGGAVRPSIFKVLFVRKNMLNKLGDWLGTSKASGRQGKA